MANTIDFSKDSSSQTSPFSIGLGSFVSPAVAAAVKAGQTGSLLTPSAEVAAKYDQPPPGAIADTGTQALVSAADRTNAALNQSTQGLLQGYNRADTTSSSAIDRNAQNLGAFLSTNAQMKGLNPYVEAGTSALDALKGITGVSGAQAQADAIKALQANPAYQFQMNQGIQAIQNSYAAKGLLNSTALAQELTNYASGAASSAIQNQVANLSGLVATGQSSAAQAASNAASLYQSQLSSDTSLQQQQIANQAELAANTAANTAGYTSSLNALQSQLAAQQQQLSIARGQLATQQNQFQTSQANQQQSDLMNNPNVVSLLRDLNANQALLDTSGGKGTYADVGEVRARISSIQKQLKQLGVQGY